MGQEDFYRAPYPVAYAAMKSGLKEIPTIHLRRLRSKVSTYAAMKSGLKGFDSSSVSISDV